MFSKIESPFALDWAQADSFVRDLLSIEKKVKLIKQKEKKFLRSV